MLRNVGQRSFKCVFNQSKFLVRFLWDTNGIWMMNPVVNELSMEVPQFQSFYYGKLQSLQTLQNTFFFLKAIVHPEIKHQISWRMIETSSFWHPRNKYTMEVDGCCFPNILKISSFVFKRKTKLKQGCGKWRVSK